MNERMKRFIDLLNQMFEMDKSDLDFGIYRILNIRRTEIQKFFNDGLPKQIRKTLEPFAQDNKDELRQQIATIEAQCGGAEQVVQLPDSMPLKQRYNTLKAQLQQGTDLSALESDVYSALYNFFNRYYDEGDFISKRRYKEGVYAIPYEGEEVKLYWANQDQYYVKTSENFKDYTFRAGDYTVHFLLVDATTEQNNNKETGDSKRQFMLFTGDEEKYPGIKTFEYDDETKTVSIRFLFDIPEDKKAKYQELNAAAIKQWLSSQDTNLMTEFLRPSNPEAKAKDQISIVEKHLKTYVAKNSFDYFIHKDLDGFLSRELDFFIKNEVMHLDDLDTENEARVETYIAKVRAIKQVGRVIIRFLAQIENFQKKLWLKKKFVVETNWCITLDRIPEEYYDEIRQNEKQVQEWVDMYAINELQPDLEHTEPFTDVPSVLFLKQNQNLIVDTKHFCDDFKQRLLASIDNLDEQCDGLLINSENFQALQLLQEKYRERVNTIYIDPPYNAKSSTILYKNSYKHSSWNSMINSRVLLGYKLMTSNGILEFAIDDYEVKNSLHIISKIFGEENFMGNICVQHNPRGRNDDKFFGTSHEYMTVYSKKASDTEVGLFKMTEEDIAQYNRTDGLSNYSTVSFIRTGNNSRRFERPNLFYPIYVNPQTLKLSLEQQDGWIKLLPISADGEEKTWRWERSTFEAKCDTEIEVRKNDNSFKLLKKRRLTGAGKKPKTTWTDSKYDASSHGIMLMASMFGSKDVFSYPKSINTVKDALYITTDTESLVLDFFAGSGTTGHAVIDLNREEDDELGQRKYILVEMGTYFNTVTKPRIKKVIYSMDWKDGKPVSRKGSSHCFKYLRLEQYEDALNNIQLQRNDEFASLFGDDYLINYMLDIEAKGSLLNLNAFKSPFSYEMRITERNEAKTQRVDLCETFNYLIGLRVQHQGIIRCYDSRPAVKPDYEGAVDLVKGTQHAFRQIEGSLPDGRKALVIWRTIGDDLQASNTALDAYFDKYRINPRDREYDVIYVNGDNNLENLRTSEETWKVVLIEQEFNKRMFAEE